MDFCEFKASLIYIWANQGYIAKPCSDTELCFQLMSMRCAWWWSASPGAGNLRGTKAHTMLTARVRDAMGQSRESLLVPTGIWDILDLMRVKLSQSFQKFSITFDLFLLELDTSSLRHEWVIEDR